MPRTWTARLPDWESRWTAWLERCRNRPFEWGIHDCTQFGVEGIREVTGREIFHEKWIYRDAETAALILRDMGFKSLLEFVTYELGPPLSSYRMAKRGDAAMVEWQGLQLLGTVLDDRVACPGMKGLVEVPLSQAIAVWEI